MYIGDWFHLYSCKNSVIIGSHDGDFHEICIYFERHEFQYAPPYSISREEADVAVKAYLCSHWYEGSVLNTMLSFRVFVLTTGRA